MAYVFRQQGAKAMTKFNVGDTVKLTNGHGPFRVCSLTVHDDVYCLETAGGWFHAHASIMKRA